MLFAAALLAFLFPFATVSCGEPVTFTGLELATARVADDAPTADQREFGDEIESNGTVLALIAVVAAAVGLGLAIAQVRGVGLAALVGLLALLLLPWSAATAMADFAVHGGYVLDRRGGRPRRAATRGRGPPQAPGAPAPLARRPRRRTARRVDRRHGRALHRVRAVRLDRMEQLVVRDVADHARR